MTSPLVMTAAALGVILGWVVGWFLTRSRERTRQKRLKAEAQDESSRILTRAREEADNLTRAGERLLRAEHGEVDNHGSGANL